MIALAISLAFVLGQKVHVLKVGYSVLHCFFDQKENEMKVWLDLISTDYGLMSLIVIAVMVVTMLGFAYYVVKHFGKQ